MASPALVAPQAVRIVQLAHDGRWLALDEHLQGEATELEELLGDDFWQVEYNDQGIAYLENAETTLWFSDYASRSVYTNSSGSRIVIERGEGGNGDLLQDLLAFHVQVEIPFEVPAVADGQVTLVGAIFRQPAWGCRVFYSVASLWERLGLDMYPGTACAWLQKRKPTLTKLFESLGLGPFAIRWSLPWVADQDATLDGRCLTWTGFPTSGLLACLCTMAWRSGKADGGLEGAKQGKLEVFLQALIRSAGASWSLQLCVDPEVEWAPGYGVEGANPITLEVTDFIIDLRPWHKAVLNTRADRSRLHAICQGYDEMHFALFFQKATNDQRFGQWLFKQLVWLVSDRLDTRIACAWEDPDRLYVDDSDSSVPKLVAHNVLGSNGRHAAAELTRYRKRGLEVFKECQFLSAAPDASKIGDKALLVSPLVDNKSGQAMWAAPQAPQRDRI